MNTEVRQQIRAEDPKAVERYEALKRLGKDFFTNSDVVKTGDVSEQDITLAKDFLTQAAQKIVPPIYATWWEHTLIAPKLGRALAEAAAAKGADVNPAELEFLLLLHDFGRLVTPTAYLRNDLICDRLLTEIGIPKETTNKGFALGSLLESTLKRHDSKAYFKSLSPTQRLHFLADNLGKLSPEGELFSLQILHDYLKSEEARYEKLEQEKKVGKGKSPWPSVGLGIAGRKTSGETGFLAKSVVEQTVKWLEDLGVDPEKVRRSLLGYGPKFVIIARHGELDNPKNIVYNKDEVMEGNIIHLSTEGRRQMRNLATLIVRRQFRCKQIATSPEIRATESAAQLSTLDVPIQTNQDLDDLYAPGPYQEKITMGQWSEMGGDAYDQRWEEYNHEKPERVTQRMKRAFWRMAKSLQTGEAGVLVSHGDPIAWLANSLVSKQVLEPKKLREGIYCPKGNALVAIIDPEDEHKVFTIFFLNEVEKDKIY